MGGLIEEYRKGVFFPEECRFDGLLKKKGGYE